MENTEKIEKTQENLDDGALHPTRSTNFAGNKKIPWKGTEVGKYRDTSNQGHPEERSFGTQSQPAIRRTERQHPAQETVATGFHMKKSRKGRQGKIKGMLSI